MSVQDFLKKRQASRAERLSRSTEIEDEYAIAEFPYLFSFLSVTRLDGKDRKPGKLILFCEDGRLKACLKDAETGEVLFVTLSGFEKLMYELDEAVSKEDADWRAGRWMARK